MPFACNICFHLIGMQIAYLLKVGRRLLWHHGWEAGGMGRVGHGKSIKWHGRKHGGVEHCFAYHAKPSSKREGHPFWEGGLGTLPGVAGLAVGGSPPPSPHNAIPQCSRHHPPSHDSQKASFLHSSHSSTSSTLLSPLSCLLKQTNLILGIVNRGG